MHGCGAELTAVSLFDGIGGFPQALASAGVRTVATVEIDTAAAGVTADHFPEAKAFNDVTEVTGDDLRAAGFCPGCGILTGGWPCQDLSLAGRRLGLGGARSGLFFEIVRLAADLRPRWLLLENVPGLLSAVCSCPGLGVCGMGCTDPHPVRGGLCGSRRGRGGRCMEIHGGAMGAVLGALAELGYGFAYRVLDAQHFGVPQRRRRVVIVGCLGDWAAPAAVLLEPEGGGGDPAPSGAPRSRAARSAEVVARGAGVVNALTSNMAGGGGGVDDNTAQGGHIVGFDAAQITSGENRSNPQPGDPQPLAATGQPHVAYALRADPGGVGQGHNTNYVQVEPEAWQGQGTNVGPMGHLRRGNGNVTGGVPFVAQTMTTSGAQSLDPEMETLITHALTAEGADASEDGTGRGTPLVPIGFGETGGDVGVGTDLSPSVRTGSGGGQTSVAAAAVRRLTPVECERLQGLPDGWTATSGGRAQADSARYRQLGNSIAVPVFAWAARRIVAAHRRLA